MLLLVTIGLVVVGAIALVVGFVSNSLAPIYLSIACSVIAGIVLVVFSRMARRGDSGPSAAAAPAQASPGSWSPSTTSTPPPPPPPAPDAPSYEPPPAYTPPPPPPPAPARATPMRRPARAPEPEPTIVLDEPVSAAAGPDDDGFPIAGYDTMRSSQIVALLVDLDLDELDMVQEREEQGKNRATVLRRVVERIDQLEAEDLDEEPLAEEDEPVEAEAFPAAADDEFRAEAADDGFPIADYDSLSADEIIAVLDDLEDDELDLVAEREELGQNRVAILDYIDDMFEEVDGQPEPEPAPARVVTPPARKAPAKKAAAKKVAVKKVAVKKAAATRATATKKVAATPAGRTTAGASKAAPRKAGATKAAAVASPGTKSAGRRTAAPVAKVAKAPAGTAATRATVKKAVAKKAAAPTRKR